MHLHMFPLRRMLRKTEKFFHRLKMRNVVSLLLPNERRLAVPGSLLFAIPLCLRRNASCIIVHCIIQGPCVHNAKGGGVSWHLNFAWEISRFKWTAKFPTPNSGSFANFSHILWTLAGGTTPNPGAARNVPQRNPPCAKPPPPLKEDSAPPRSRCSSHPVSWRPPARQSPSLAIWGAPFGRYYSDGVIDNGLEKDNWCGGQAGALVLGQDQDVVGGNFDVNQAANMDVAYVYVYSTAFDASKVAERTALGATSPEPGAPLAAAWLFDGNDPMQATDISGYGTTMSVVGAPLYVPYSAMPTCGMPCPSDMCCTWAPLLRWAEVLRGLCQCQVDVLTRRRHLSRGRRVAAV